MATPSPSDRTPSLPTSLTSFIGREREVASVGERLRRADVRLLTLTGAGGVGKTRLALTVAAALSGDFAEGACFVSLGAISDPSLVVPTVAQAFGLRELGRRPLRERLTGHLQNRHLLLVLDNFEHVLPAAPVVVDVLAQCPGLQVLVTSRTVLHISGEHDYLVHPLALPGPALGQRFEQLACTDAIRLFVERAQAARADFALTEENAPSVAAICRRVDGLPLAIELAAARVSHLPPAALLDRLTLRLPLLTGGPRDQPIRLQTMRNAIAWSYDLLSPAEQALFHRLAVFAGGCTLEAAEMGDGSPVTLDGLASLVDKRLLRQEEGPGEEPRYTMLETIREFGAEQLETSGEGADVRSRHAGYFLDLIERLWTGWFRGAGVAERLGLVEVERDNLRAALAWADEQGAAEVAARITHALRMFWRIRGPVSEGREWSERVLAYRTALPVHLRVDLLCGAGDLAHVQGDLARSLELKKEAVALARAAGPPVLLAGALHFLGVTLLAQDHDDEAERLFAEALAVFRAAGDTNWAATALGNLAAVAWRRGDATKAVVLLEESLRLGREIGGNWAVAHILGALANAVADLGNDDVRARQLYRESLEQLWDLQDKRRFAGILAGVAGFAATRGKPERAARLCGAIEALLEALDVTLVPSDQTSFQRAVAATRSAMGEDALRSAWSEGRAMPLELAYADAIVAISASGPTSSVAAGTDREDAATRFGLTRRESEVLLLLAEGQSDREIAEALFISPKTVGLHVRNILAKLGVPTRVAAVAWSHRHGLA